jgi:hypothetical protein
VLRSGLTIRDVAELFRHTSERSNVGIVYNLPQRHTLDPAAAASFSFWHESCLINGTIDSDWSCIADAERT